MAKYGPSSAFLLVGGCDVSALTFSLDETVEQTIDADVRGLSESWDRALPVGIARVNLEAAPGLYDDEAATNNEAYAGMGATRQLVAFGFNGSASGAGVVHLDGDYAATFKRQARKDGLTLAGAAHKIHGKYLRGTLIGGWSLRSGDGNTEAASNDGGAGTSDGYTVDLHVPQLSLGGGTNVVVTVRHSTDNVVWADLVSFTAVTAAGSAERKTASGAVNRYLAIKWAFTGGAAQTVTPVVVLSRSQV